MTCDALVAVVPLIHLLFSASDEDVRCAAGAAAPLHGNDFQQHESLRLKASPLFAVPPNIYWAYPVPIMHVHCAIALLNALPAASGTGLQSPGRSPYLPFTQPGSDTVYGTQNEVLKKACLGFSPLLRKPSRGTGRLVSVALLPPLINLFVQKYNSTC